MSVTLTAVLSADFDYTPATSDFMLSDIEIALESEKTLRKFLDSSWTEDDGPEFRSVVRDVSATVFSEPL